MADNDKPQAHATQTPSTEHADTPPTGREPTRAEREAKAVDVPQDETVISATGAEMRTPDSPVLTKAASNLIVETARQMAGREYTPPEPDTETRRGDARRSSPKRVQGDPLMALSAAIARSQEADPVFADEQHPPAPGETERGWSPEVTARHPLVQAEVMAELAGVSASPRRSSANSTTGRGRDYIDPTDLDAVTRAIREIGFHDVRMQDLRNKATRLASDRLAAAREAALTQSPHIRLSMEEAVAKMQDVARAEGYEV